MGGETMGVEDPRVPAMPRSLTREDLARFIHETWCCDHETMPEDYVAADGILLAIERQKAGCL